MSSIPHKCCSKCGADKPLDQFPYYPKADRYRANCKDCERKRRKAWYDQNKEYFRRRAETHREQMRAAGRRYADRNRKKRNVARRVHYYRNAIAERQKARERNRKNLERRAAYYNKYRTRKLGNGGEYTAQEWLDLCAKYNYRCLACERKRRLTADHVIPVSKGGTSNIDNIQPLCHSCNARKRDKIIDYRIRYESGYSQEEMFL